MVEKTRTLIKSYLWIIAAAGFFAGYGAHVVSTITPQTFYDLGAFRHLTWLFWGGGTALLAYTVWWFGSGAGSSPAFVEAPKHLVIEGPYRFVRNPMYVSQLLIVTGHFFWTGGQYALLYLACYALAVFLIALAEQPRLRRLFPREYAEYCRNVPGWLPRFTPYTPVPPAPAATSPALTPDAAASRKRPARSRSLPSSASGSNWRA